jgi:acetyl-CoA C-acetyltransferase
MLEGLIRGTPYLIPSLCYAGFRTTSQDVSYREIIFEAAVKCYEDAGGIHPREVNSFVAAGEDFMEGISIVDEYVPDQLGAVLKPGQAITGGRRRDPARSICIKERGTPT